MQLKEVFLDTQVLFDKFLLDRKLIQQINVRILANNNQCHIGRVIKANQLIKFCTSEDIFIIINETTLEKLTLEQKEIVVKELVSNIGYDGNKSDVSITTPDVKYYSEFIKRVGYNKLQELADCMKILNISNTDKYCH